MIKILISSVLTVVATIGGLAGGMMLRPGPAEHSLTSSGGAGQSSHASDEKGGKQHDESFLATESVMNPDYIPMRFSRPFVVPIGDSGRASGLVVIQMNVELYKNAGDGVLGLEQRMRDRIMTALLDLSHKGGFSGTISDPEISESVKQVAKQAADSLLPGKVGDVLILEILRRHV
ncbi:MAG: hypothetical protein ACWA5T_09490 [Parvularcula sp.]